MKRFLVGTGLAALLLSTDSHAQSGAVMPPVDATHPSEASCVILKRMGRVGRAESRLYHFGISGKHFRYVEGKLPEGFATRHKMTDHDVRKLQARGAQVLVLDSHYTSDDLKEARAACAGHTGKTPNLVEAKASPASVPAPVASTSAPAPTPLTAKAPSPKADDSASSTGTTGPPVSTPAPIPNGAPARTPAPKSDNSTRSMGATEAALVDVSSTPAGADVYIDEHFFGQTPATTIILTPGNHKITVKKDGFAVWKTKMNLPSGRINVAAELLPKSK